MKFQQLILHLQIFSISLHIIKPWKADIFAKTETENLIQRTGLDNYMTTNDVKNIISYLDANYLSSDEVKNLI